MGSLFQQGNIGRFNHLQGHLLSPFINDRKREGSAWISVLVAFVSGVILRLFWWRTIEFSIIGQTIECCGGGF
jgi:tRNA A37 threonylcarbamoyltransferase TsaD